MSFWNLLGGLVNAGASVYSQVQTNKNIDKQLAAQKQENEATREYNMNLAKQQNQWNIEQWNRENAYNTPSAQKERIKDAGLNADMLYGQGTLQNTAAASPQMTSGAAATPMDWTALGSKQAVGVDALNSFLDAQLKQAQLDSLNQDNDRKGIENKYLEAEKQLGLNISRQTYEKNEKDIELLLQTIEQNKVKYESMSVELMLQRVDSAYRADIYQKQLDILAKELDLKTNEVDNMVRAKALELAGKDVDNKLREAQLKWNDPSILEKLGGDGAASLLKILMMIFK